MPALDTATLEQIAIGFFRDRKQSLVEYAKPYSLEDLIQTFQNLRQGMQRLLNGLSEEQVTFSPDPNTYSLSEVVTHLIAAQGNTYNGLLDLAASKLPHIDPVPRGPGAGAEKGVSSKEMQEKLKQATEMLVKVAQTVHKDAEEKVTEVQSWGMMSERGWMLFQILHDLDHLKQAQVLRRSAGFPRKIITS